MSEDQVGVILARLAALDKTLERIETKVTETNGRVRSLELWKASVEGFRRGVGVSFQWLPAVVASVVAAVVVGLVASLTPIL